MSYEEALWNEGYDVGYGAGYKAAAAEFAAARARIAALEQAARAYLEVAVSPDADGEWPPYVVAHQTLLGLLKEEPAP